jgi:hypothetical protein
MAPLTYHSSLAHAAYHDLLRSLLDEAVSAVRGTPTRAERNGRVYWYDTYRVGSEVKKTYIGEDSEALRQRLGNIPALRTALAAARSNRTRLIRILRAEGFLGVDAGTGSLLAAMAKAGVFRLGGTLVGTIAFRLYEGELGVRFALDQAAQTNDIDIASFERLSLALGDVVEEALPSLLAGFSFAPAPVLDARRAWRWKQSRSETLVEFLTPAFTEREEPRPLPALGVDAQSLHYLNYLIAEPIKAVVTYRSGVLVQIPRPERFAIHKLIVSDRRQGGPDSLKAVKDRRQAAMLIDILARDRPDELREAYAEALARGPRWRKRLQAGVARIAGLEQRLAAL